MTPRATRGGGPALGALFFAASVAGVTSTARADDRAADDFAYGLAEMLAGRYAAGCPALEESYRLDPRPGTLFTLAECNLKRGKTASALAQYEQFVVLCSHMAPDQRSAQSERLAIANQEQASLATRVPRLVVRLRDASPAGMLVRLDDTVLGGPLLGAAIPVDPGSHVVVSETPDGRRIAVPVLLSDGEQKTVVAAPPPARPASDVAPPSAAPMTNPLAPIPPQPAPHRPSTYVVGTAGLLGVAAAGITGLVALGKASTARRDCDAMGVCTSAEGASAGNSAHGFADASTISLSAGVLGLAAAVVLWLTESPSPAPRSIATGSF